MYVSKIQSFKFNDDHFKNDDSFYRKTRSKSPKIGERALVKVDKI